MADAVWSFINTRGSAAMLIADKLSKLTGATHYTDDSIESVSEIDRLLVVAGGAAFAGTSNLAAIARHVVTARRVVWVINDYSASLPKLDTQAASPYRACFRDRRGAPVVRWSTVRAHADAPGSSLVNLNSLHLVRKPPVQIPSRVQALLYYGYFREGRVGAFERYFSDPLCDVALSYPERGKSAQWFSRYNSPRVSHLGKLADLDVIGGFRMGLYLEDQLSHSEYHSPPARFYEMVGRGLPITIQPEAVRTLQLGGYKVYDEDVSATPAEVANSMSRAEDVLHSQATRWLGRAADECDRVIDQIRTLWRGL